MSLANRRYYVVTPATDADTLTDPATADSATPVPRPFRVGRRPALRGGDRYLVQTPGPLLADVDGAVEVGDRATHKPTIDTPDWRTPEAKDWTALRKGETYASVRWARVALPLSDEHAEYVRRELMLEPESVGKIGRDADNLTGDDALIPVAGNLPREFYAAKRKALYSGPADAPEKVP